MKKNYLIIFTILLIIPFSVFAAETPIVLTVTADVSGSTINYTGTTEDDVHAVMCKLFNSSDEEIDMLSSSVDNNSFSGSFTNVSDGTYNVLCARYEGGEVKSVEVVVGATTNNTSTSPKTYDAGIRIYLLMLIISIIGVAISLLHLKKRKEVNSN